MKFKLFLLLSVLFFLVTSCGTVEDDINNILGDTGTESTLTPDKENNKDSETIAKDDTGSAMESSEADSEIIRLAKAGAFKKAIDAGTAGSEEAKYYQGIANYNLMLAVATYPETQRVEFKNEAIRLLKQVGFEGRDDSLAGRALLWYGMAVHLNQVSLKGKREALGAFQRIQSTRLKDTTVNDDSLLYTGQIYQQMGWYIQARKFYKKLNNVTSSDNRVWDAEYKVWSTPAEAGTRGLDKVRQICLGEGASSSSSSSDSSSSTEKKEETKEEPAKSEDSSTKTETKTETKEEPKEEKKEEKKEENLDDL